MRVCGCQVKAAKAMILLGDTPGQMGCAGRPTAPSIWSLWCRPVRRRDARRETYGQVGILVTYQTHVKVSTVCLRQREALEGTPGVHKATWVYWG